MNASWGAQKEERYRRELDNLRRTPEVAKIIESEVDGPTKRVVCPRGHPIRNVALYEDHRGMLLLVDAGGSGRVDPAHPTRTGPTANALDADGLHSHRGAWDCPRCSYRCPKTSTYVIGLYVIAVRTDTPDVRLQS